MTLVFKISLLSCLQFARGGARSHEAACFVYSFAQRLAPARAVVAHQTRALMRSVRQTTQRESVWGCFGARVGLTGAHIAPAVCSAAVRVALHAREGAFLHWRDRRTVFAVRVAAHRANGCVA